MDIKNLEENMSEYKQLDKQLKEIETRQKQLKIQNLSIMKSLKLESHTYENLIIRIVRSTKKIGVDENKLINLIGPDRVNSLKIIPVDAVTRGISDKTIPEAALYCILTVPQSEYTMIKEIKPSEKIDISG